MREFIYKIYINDEVTELVYAPSGWKDDNVTEFNRSAMYRGIIRNIANDLKFVEDGARLLRNQWYRYNVNAVAFLEVLKNTDGWNYQRAYYGKLDFSQARDSDDYFVIKCTDADIEAKIKAFENVKYEIPVIGGIDVRMTPLKLVESATFIVQPTFDIQRKGYAGIDLIVNEVVSREVSSKSVPYRETGSPNFAVDADWFFRAQTNTTVTLNLKSLKGSFTRIGDTAPNYAIGVIKSDGSTAFNLVASSAVTGVNNFDVPPTEFTTTVTAGQSLYLYQYYPGPTDINSFAYTEGEFSIKYETESAATVIKALRPKELFRQLIKQVNGNFDYPVSSSLLDEWKELTVTCGDALRGFADAKIKISLADFFKSINAELFASISVENNIVYLERGTNVFRNISVLDLTDSKGVEITAAADLMYNSVKVGYKDQNYDELNGRDEVNSEQRYVVDTIQAAKELDLTSEIRADAYGIEFARINLSGKETTDSDSDNDNFFVDITSTTQTSGYYEPNTIDKAAATITGVLAHGSYYNWRLFPSRMIRRHGTYLRSLFYNNDGYQLRFTGGDKNTNVSVTQGGTTIQEGVNISMAELDAPFFIPMYADFVSDSPNDLWQYINNSVYGAGTFKYKGQLLKGYFINLSLDLAKNSERDFKLLLTVDNNLLKLIK